MLVIIQFIDSFITLSAFQNLWIKVCYSNNYASFVRV
jgi:hypothetical protein